MLPDLPRTAKALLEYADQIQQQTDQINARNGITRKAQQ